MKSLHFLAILALASLPGVLIAQNTYLTEDFSTGVPPTGWIEGNNGNSLGWELDGGLYLPPGHAFHDDFTGWNDNYLMSPQMDLSTATQAFAYCAQGVYYWSWRDHHYVDISLDNGLTFINVADDAPLVNGYSVLNVDISSYAGINGVNLAYHYTGDYASEWSVDNIVVDDVGPPPPPPAWPNLPTTFQPANGFTENFDTIAGTVPSYMAINELDILGNPSTIAWCNIGQRGVCTATNSGAYCLEMGLDPIANGVIGRSGLVLGLDGSGVSQDLYFDAYLTDWYVDDEGWDGIWVSDDGSTWHQAAGPWSSLTNGYYGTFTSSDKINISNTGADVSGPFYLLIAEVGMYGYAIFGGLGVDDINIDLIPPPPPFPNLPTSFVIADGYSDDFESYAGVVPAHMGINALDSNSGLPDLEAWCNIGQRAPCLGAASGIYCLEMGLDPNSNNYHDVRNGLVLGMNGAGSSGFLLDFQSVNHGEESDLWDGVWVTEDGINWLQASGAWTGTSTWAAYPTVDLGTAGADLSGYFYLMFAQDDNFPYGYLDGIGVDDISLVSTGTVGPILAVSNLVAGGVTTISISNATPNNLVRHGYSATGGGPLATPYGDLLLSPPFVELPMMPTDANGDSSMTAPVPPFASGIAVWLHAFDLGSLTFSNGLAVVIG